MRAIINYLKALGKVNKTLVAVILILSTLGLTMVFSAGSYSSQAVGNSATEPLTSQLVYMILGIGAMLVLSTVDYRAYKNGLVWAGFLFIAFFLLAIVIVPGIGQNINGSTRWILIPYVGITIQPGEIAKFALVFYTAHMLSRKNAPTNSKDFLLKTALPVLAVAGGMFLLVMGQPNLSTAGCILIAAALMLLIGGMSWKHFLILVVLGVAVGFAYAMSAEYRRDRLTAFMDPWGMSDNEAYQLTQSLLAIASGGLFGVGIGQSRQKLLFLPYCDSDFIFAIVCEELGLVGAVAVLALFSLLIFTGFKVAMRCKDRFGSMLAAGITVVYAVQVTLNVAVVIGAFPTTGLPLPFFSAGGSNLIIFMMAAGVLLNISRSTTSPLDAIKNEKVTPQKQLPDNVRSFRPSG